MDFVEKLTKLFILFLFIVLILEIPGKMRAKNSQRTVVTDILDLKDFKKLLRTKNNVLALFINSVKQSSSIIKVFEETAELIKGQGTMMVSDCSGDGKKLCRKLKISPDPYILKHYKDGEFHKNYDRKDTVTSMLNFMRDPTGDIPWDEDPLTVDVIHIPDPVSLSKFLKKELGKVMVMFYAPWCGFCKQLKPEYSAAASELKGHSILAAVDVNKPENAVIRSKFNITGFPTLIYFENGIKKFNYESENNRKSLVEFMKNPTTSSKPIEIEWSAVENEIKHLTDDTFDEVLSEIDSALVMFYAPWCGHCKRLKPEYEKAAEKMKVNKISGMLAALDATKEKKLAKKYNVNSYPTLKYFKKNEFQFDVNLREEKDLIDFMKTPKKPLPPPPPEKPWTEEDSEVIHLTTETFKSFLKKKKHVLVMFYAPWCGHCKKAKPEFTASAEIFKDDPKIEFAAVDCTTHSSVCSAYNVKGYPTIKLFHYLNKDPAEEYNGGRTELDFTSFMKQFTGDKIFNLNSVKKSNENHESNITFEDWNGLENSDLVLHLSDNNFDYSVTKHESILIFFYEIGCLGCEKIKKVYSDVALMLVNAKIPAKLAAYNASENKKIIGEKNIKGFPALHYYKRGKFIRSYTEKYSATDVFNFLKKSVEIKFDLKKEEL